MDSPVKVAIVPKPRSRWRLWVRAGICGAGLAGGEYLADLMWGPVPQTYVGHGLFAAAAYLLAAWSEKR